MNSFLHAGVLNQKKKIHREDIEIAGRAKPRPNQLGSVKMPNVSLVGIDNYSVKMKEYVLCVFPSYVESSRPQTPFQSRLKRILVEACPP